MSRNELIAKIETLRNLEALIEEAKREAETVRDSIKAEMEAVETEELSAGGYIVRWTSVLSTRFDTKSHPADSVSAHEKSPLSERLPSHRQRASYHTPKERVQ